MADPIIKVDIDNTLYDPAKILEKTLVAARDMKVYLHPPDKYNKGEELGIVKKGDPVGIVYSWLAPDPIKNRSVLWWMFYPASAYSKYYYAPHDEDDFDLSALRQQGVISVGEQIEEDKKKEEEENKEWYEKLFDKALPAVIGVVLGIAAIRALGNVIASRAKK
jgi:hypothetical protein